MPHSIYPAWQGKHSAIQGQARESAFRARKGKNIGHKAFKSNAGLVHEQLLIGGFGCQSRQEQTGNKRADENCAKNVYEMDIRVR